MSTETLTNGSAPSIENSAGGMQFKFLAHVQSLPVVTDSLDQLYSYPIGRNAGETLKAASATAFKFTGPINPLLQKADSFADNGLKNIESRFPLVKAPTSEIKEKTSGAAKTTVDTYVGAFHDKFGATTAKARENGHELGDEAKAQTNGAKHSIHDSIDPVLKPVLDTVEGLLDTYLPKAQAKAASAKENAESAVDDAADKAPKTQAEAEAQAKRVYNITLSMFDRSTNAAKNTVHFGVDKVATGVASASEYVQWGVNNPKKVPEAALNKASTSTASIRNRVDGTVQVTRDTALTLTDLASQARDTAFAVYNKESKAAPKDQPRGLLIAAINTTLVLTGKSLDHAKTFFQNSNGRMSTDIKKTANDLSEKVDETADAVSSKVNKNLPEEKEVKGSLHKGKDQVHQTAKQASQSIEEILHREHQQGHQ